MTEQFQTSLFGYSKRSVHLYISQMNEDFSNRLLEKEKEGREAVRAMNEELERLREENEQLRAERRDVAGALIDAKSFAAELREQAEEADRVQRAKNEDIHRTELQRIRDLAEHIDQLRTEFRSALSTMDDELEQYALLCKALHAQETELSVPQETELSVPQEESTVQQPICNE